MERIRRVEILQLVVEIFTAEGYFACMKSPKSAPELLVQFYLHMRSALIETAAAFDRIQLAEEAERVWQDPRLVQLREAAVILAGDDPGRARRILEILSDKEERDA